MAASKTFDVGNGAVLNVSFSGSRGPVLIFLHFWGGSSRTFSPVTEILSTQFRNIAVDFRGWGASIGPQSNKAYSIQILADDIEYLIAELKLESYFIIGHSMGGKVAQLLAGRGRLPGLEGVVLIAPAPACPLVLPAEAREQQLSAYNTQDNATFVARNILTSTSLPDATIAFLVEDMLKGTPAAKNAWPHYSMLEDVVAEAMNIAVPVLVVAASADHVEPLERLQLGVLDVIPQASMVVIEGSGHIIPVEAPLELSRHISSFVNANSKVH